MKSHMQCQRTEKDRSAMPCDTFLLGRNPVKKSRCSGRPSNILWISSFLSPFHGSNKLSFPKNYIPDIVLLLFSQLCGFWVFVCVYAHNLTSNISIPIASIIDSKLVTSKMSSKDNKVWNLHRDLLLEEIRISNFNEKYWTKNWPDIVIEMSYCLHISILLLKKKPALPETGHGRWANRRPVVWDEPMNKAECQLVTGKSKPEAPKFRIARDTENWASPMSFLIAPICPQLWNS